MKEDKFIQSMMEEAYLHTKSMCKLFLEETFSSPFSTLHDQIFELIDSGHNKIAIAAPRGIGKTSIARSVAIKAILYRLTKFIVYVSNSATMAEMQTENIKRDLLTNIMIKKLFGSIKLSDFEGADDTFSKSAWVAFGNTFVLPRGSGQQVRGINWSNHRPEIVIIDDLEDKDEVKNEEIRKKQKDWFFSDLLKTEDKYGKPTTFIYIDTIKHEDSLLEILMDAPEWASLRLSICDSNYNTLDENYMTTEEIKDEIEQHRNKGLMDLFYMERMNIPISIEDAVFRQEYFKYFEDQGDKLVIYRTNEKGEVEKEEIDTKRLLHVVIVDPAKTVSLQSAESAVITVAVDRESHKIFVRDVFNEKVRPDALYDAMFAQVLRYNARILGVEVTSLHQFISQPIENEMRVRGLYPTYLEIPARGKKAERVATLAPLYKLGYMYHNKTNCGPVEAQLRWFPRSKYWDVMDALAYITYIMDKLAYYFDPEELGDDPEEEFSELEYEDPIGDWRAA